MGKYTLDSLLIIANRFEKLAVSSLSETLGDSFKRQVMSITKTNPTSEEWGAWLDANRTVIGDLATQYWGRSFGNIIFSDLGNDTAYITISPDLPSSDFERTSFATLRASSPLPQLWLQIGHTESSYRTPMSLPELGHYEWLVSGIRQILGGYSNREIAEFLAKNKSKIDKVRRTFETQNPKYLGGGADGAAFNIGGGKVLKLFRDESSYQKALLAFDRLHKSPSLAKTEAMIYDIGILGKIGAYPDDPYSGRDVYYYIIEMMRPVRDLFVDPWRNSLSRLLAQIAKRVEGIRDSKLRALKKGIQDPSKSDLIKKVVRDAAAQISNDLKQDRFLKRDVEDVKDTMSSLKDNWLELYVEEVIMKYLTGRTDLHMGNLGLTGYGELRYYDPAYGGHESEINI